MTTAPKGPTKEPCKIDFTGSPRVLATDEKGDWPICDIRGWGHLTGKGHGALGLPHDLAAAIQDANAAFIAEAFNVYHDTGLTPRQLAEQRDELLEALTYLMEMTEPPERNCSCHLNPPCGWCVEYSGIADAHAQARAAIASATSAKGGAK